MKRCAECPRPVCQRVLTLRGCKQQDVGLVDGEPLNEYKLYDSFGNG